MKKIIINGKYAGDRMQGIVRYAHEIILALDELCAEVDITILLPPNVQKFPDLKNIERKTYGKHTGILWEQIDLAGYMKKNQQAICLNFCNVAPFFCPSWYNCCARYNV